MTPNSAGRSRAPLFCLVAFSAALSCPTTDGGRTAAPAWLRERAQQEHDLAAQSQTFHDFTFTDELKASGITFVNHVVEDAGKNYKAVHYDHGTGICAADVD